MMAGGLFRLRGRKVSDLEADPYPNGKPVQFFKNQFDMFSMAGAFQHPNKAVLDTLQLVHVRPSDAGQKCVVVVQPESVDSTDHCDCGRMIHSPSQQSKPSHVEVLYVEVRGLADSPCVLVERQ